jgi:hypothetical protein
MNNPITHDVMADTWTATDALGRSLPTYEQVGPPRGDRFVGIFYFICNVYRGDDGPYDVTQALAQDPAHPPFKPGKPHYWGQPEMGYYLSTDRWAIRKHAYMLADAGVDTLIFDVTNNHIFLDSVNAVCEVFRQVRQEGEYTPDICFLGSQKSIAQLWDAIYSQGLYQDLWFHWQGKPLLLFGQHAELHGDMNAAQFPPEIQNFFTLRKSWAWDSLAWYGEDGYHRWPWVAHYPQCVGWDQPGVAEQVPVAVAQHPLSNIGRSFHDGQQPACNEYDVTPFTGQGLHFGEQWRRALEIDPQFIFVTGWNEWMAGSMYCDDPSQAALQAKWSFYPGATLGRAGRPLHAGDIYFIDQYNQEFSRDAEPMRGGHSDNYYYQLVDGIRRYKGVRPPPPPSGEVSIDLAGSFAQWDGVQPTYRDHLYDTPHRHEPGFGAAGPYVNTSGRNEFVALKVARDAERLYFYAQTREALTPSSDPNWMLLFINANQRKDTGWEGYDYLLNWPLLDGRRTTVKQNVGGWAWRDIGVAEYRTEGNQLMLAVPRALLGMEGRALSFDFHWADNIPCSGYIEDFFLYGDSAPSRRFDYRYRS